MKKRIMIKWSVLPAVLLTLMVISSCKNKFLDRQPLGRYVETDVPAGSYDSKIFATYSLLRAGGFNNHLYLGIMEFRSDEADKGSSVSDGADQGQMFDEFQYNKSNGGIQEFWTAHYALIIAANSIIADIDSLNLTDPNTLVNRAEAKFLRAYAYWDLVRAFGQVPKIEFKVNDAAQVNIPKSTEGEIFTLIDADLAEAASILPVSWDPKYIGRLTKGAAMALQAKAALWRSDWAGTLNYCKEVINLNQYSLVNDYGSQFRNFGENGPESIFEIQAYYTTTETGLGIQYAQVQGVRGAGQWDLGWGWDVPTQKLVDEYEAGDPRRIATILYSGQVDPLFGENVPPVPTVPQPYWNKKIYTNPADRLALNNRFGNWMDHRIFRFADVLLMAAEAANELGGAQNTTDALGWLELIRARARGTSGSLPPVTTTDQTALRTAIRHERFVELAMEEQRFYDLVRWGIDVTVLPASGSPLYQQKNRLLPIPQGEIDKSGGVLIQNPNY
ncbi:MAG: RagB/SusD family nutrient uptake outer membrane protein [Ginsengibacter sp.]